MKRILFLFLALTTFVANAQPGPGAGGPPAAKSRVVKNDASKLRAQGKIHDGAGTMAFTQLFGPRELTTNLMYLHAGVINANSSIGEHFHHSMEEMYVLLEGEAEFTINGRTSLIKAPALVPCKLGDAHGMYNTSGKTCKWLNFGIGKSRGGGGGVFNLGDPRLPGSTPLDAIPQFVSGRLDREKLRAGNTYTGTGITSRRLFSPDVFQTNWNNVDHVLMPANTAMGTRTMEGFEEIYYVVNGAGNVDINGTKYPVTQDDAFYGAVGEKLTISSTSELELLVVCIAVDKTKMPAAGPRFGAAPVPGASSEAIGSAVTVGSAGATGGVAAAQPKAMLLQMDFVVEKKNALAFEKMYTSIYVPAMRKQVGYLESKLVRIYPAATEKKIEGESTDYNYQLQLSYDTEVNRMKWVHSKEHMGTAWPAAVKLAKSFKWRGYDVIGDDNVKIK
ncbi:cupin domain-containing protein [Mucilaginibacter calamicampi]|uniref:Cupin domain-containing protein n=1 Tax=Mucilaginibacter calamicampi TaxID=1302352 RepID=A0ABW2Z015_9SPHI